jgi:hypothetical protein
MGYEASPAPIVIPHPSKKLARKLPCYTQVQQVLYTSAIHKKPHTMKSHSPPTCNVRECSTDFSYNVWHCQTILIPFENNCTFLIQSSTIERKYLEVSNQYNRLQGVVDSKVQTPVHNNTSTRDDKSSVQTSNTIRGQCLPVNI